MFEKAKDIFTDLLQFSVSNTNLLEQPTIVPEDDDLASTEHIEELLNEFYEEKIQPLEEQTKPLQDEMDLVENQTIEPIRKLTLKKTI